MLCSRLIVESKDEHDFDPRGRDFGRWLQSDFAAMAGNRYVPTGNTGQIKFSMLRQSHFEVARTLFGTEDFDRLFVVHAIDAGMLTAARAMLATHRIHWLTANEVVHDLTRWYRQHPRPSGLRHSLIGDLWHLLVGFCGFTPPQESTDSR